VRKQCTVCGQEFDAKRNTAKYCSRRCNVRAARQPKPGVPQSDHPQMPVDPDAELWTATLAELAEAGRAGSASGQAALLLARRLDSQLAETGSSVAAMVREHRAALADALKGGGAEANPLDELRARRERKLDAG
jgi:hypothetical protein